MVAFENGGIGAAEILYRSNILALVGGGSCPQFPVSKVMLWDDTKCKCVGELSFHNAVKGVKIRKDVIVVVLEKKVYVYNFVDLQIRFSFDTASNPQGIFALSLEPQNMVLAYPSSQAPGAIRVEHIGNVSSGPSTTVEKTVNVEAHESDLWMIELNRAGTLIASASEKGTIVRVFSTHSGEVLHELRRGADRATIYSICFSADSKLLACTSDKCTIHIFSVSTPRFHLTNESQSHDGNVDNTSQTGQEEEGSNLAAKYLPQNLRDIAEQAQGVLKDSFGTYLPKYFTTETRRSVVRFPVQETQTKCAFGPKPNTVYVVGMDGSFSNYAFDTESGGHERLFYGSIHDPV